MLLKDQEAFTEVVILEIDIKIQEGKERSMKIRCEYNLGEVRFHGHVQ